MMAARAAFALVCVALLAASASAARRKEHGALEREAVTLSPTAEEYKRDLVAVFTELGAGVLDPKIDQAIKLNSEALAHAESVTRKVQDLQQRLHATMLNEEDHKQKERNMARKLVSSEDDLARRRAEADKMEWRTRMEVTDAKNKRRAAEEIEQVRSTGAKFQKVAELTRVKGNVALRRLNKKLLSMEKQIPAWLA